MRAKMICIDFEGVFFLFGLSACTISSSLGMPMLHGIWNSSSSVRLSEAFGACFGGCGSLGRSPNPGGGGFVCASFTGGGVGGGGLMVAGLVEDELPEVRGGVLCRAGLSEVEFPEGGGVLCLASLAAMAGTVPTQMSFNSVVSDLTGMVKAFTSASQQARRTRREAGADTSRKTASRLTSTLGHSTYRNLKA